MSVYKRGGVYWCDFTVYGLRFRKSLDVTTEREATMRERDEIAKAKQGHLAVNVNDVARANFGLALDKWLEERRSGIGRSKPLSPRTIQTEKERAVTVKKSLGVVPVKRIQAETVHEYIATRKKAGAANGTVNRELDLIRGVLKKASRWAFMADQVKSLPPGETIGRILGR